MSTLSRRHGWTTRKDDTVLCVCKPVNKKHTQGWHCVTKAQLEAWRGRVPDARLVRRTEDAKRLAYLWLHFSDDAEARRLSGRKPDPGLDQWDDAAGMTELQKGMFEP